MRRRSVTAFFTADLHLGHGNIIRHCNRPFASADEMDRLLIDVINASVGRNDALYILGDLTGPRAKRDEAIAYRERILCRHVHLIGGNHDRDCRGTGCFEGECFYRKIKLEKRKIILFHYPIAEWDGKWRGSIHLHGHSHNGPEYNQRSIDEGLLRFDVGVDANGFRPVSQDEILELALRAETNRTRQ